MANTVDKVLNIAELEVGYLEKKSNAQLDSKTANAGYNNYTKYCRDMHKIYPSVMDFPAAWCDCFVDWCFYKVYGKANAKSLLAGDFNDNTVISAQLYKNKNAWYKSPKVGDQIFFTDSKGGICHTGLIYNVDTLYVYTIEGNTSGASGVVANGGGVCKKKYAKTYSRIAGYGRPKYDVEKTTTTTKKKSIATIAQEVIDGKWGSGDERKTKLKNAGYDYNKVQLKVNELLVNKKKSKPNNVATPTLRKGSTSKQVGYLQQDLNYILGIKLDVDKDFGGATANAVKQFQNKYGLTVDGVYGEKTYKKMKSLLA